MNGLRRPPGWLAAAALVLVSQTLVSFALDPSLTKAASIAVAVLFASLMLWGSRIAWVVALTSAGGQIASSAISTESYWALAAGVVVFICLLVPHSLRFIWTQRPYPRAGRLQLAVKGPYGRVKASAYGLLARVAKGSRLNY